MQRSADLLQMNLSADPLMKLSDFQSFIEAASPSKMRASFFP